MNGPGEAVGQLYVAIYSRVQSVRQFSPFKYTDLCETVFNCSVTLPCSCVFQNTEFQRWISMQLSGNSPLYNNTSDHCVWFQKENTSWGKCHLISTVSFQIIPGTHAGQYIRQR